MKKLKKKVKQFNKKNQRKLFLGDIGSALGANGGAGAGMLGAGAGLMMATMGSDKEEAERQSLETDLRSREMELMMTVNKRSGELGSLESKVNILKSISNLKLHELDSGLNTLTEELSAKLFEVTSTFTHPLYQAMNHPYPGMMYGMMSHMGGGMMGPIGSQIYPAGGSYSHSYY